MRRWQDVKLEDRLRKQVECPQCKVDVHTFFGDDKPTISYICMHDTNKSELCKCNGNMEDCPVLHKPKICELNSVSNKYTEILNKLEERIKLEEKKYPLSDREKMLADAIIELLSTYDNTI